MKTYQDLTALGADEAARMGFILTAIDEHKASEMYRIAFDACEYDRQRNVSILAFQKMLFDLNGRATPDLFSPNNKLCSNFFNRFVTQENQYLLGNGVELEKGNKAKLGAVFDQRLQAAGRCALVQGVAFGFWNMDHLEVFRLTEFVPLYDEENGALMAGIRYWQIGSEKPLRATLYEPDGYTDYFRARGGRLEIRNGKRPYKQVVRTSEADGAEIIDGENYPGFPIVPLWGNPNHQSELVGMRENIDAYDLIKSGFANDLDNALVYWALKNAGGMDDVDIARFMDRLRTLGVAVGDADGDSPEMHTVEIPYASRVAYLDRLEQDMYNDFQALNVTALQGGQKTATEINAAYLPLDLKTDQFEYCVLDFLHGLFRIVGIEDEPSFTRNKIGNTTEAMQTLMLAANYLDDEYVTQKACAILGDPDAAEEILKRRAAEALFRGDVTEDEPPVEVTEDGEA